MFVQQELNQFELHTRKRTSKGYFQRRPGLICQSNATEKISLKLTGAKIYIFHSVILVQVKPRKLFPTVFQFCKIFHEMHFTSEVFADNGEPAKFNLILETFFFSQCTRSLLCSLKFVVSFAHLKFRAFIFVMQDFWSAEASVY